MGKTVEKSHIVQQRLVSFSEYGFFFFPFPIIWESIPGSAQR
jgi:hypothetical protein